MNTRGRFAALACAACWLAMLVGCTTNPATGRLQWNQMSLEQEVEVGREAAQQVLAEEQVLQDQVVQGYVSSVGNSIANQVEEKYVGLPWSFTVIDSDQINAFALPGGQIFLYRGLLARMGNEDQLAGVLAHEIGHVVGEHADDRMTRAAIAQGIITAGGIFAGSATENEQLAQILVGAGSAGSTLYLLKFSRSQEAESDTLGLRYMVEAGYNPEGMLQLMEILEQASQGGQRQPEFLATHPYPETRIDTIVEALRNEYREVATRPLTVQPFEQNVLSRLR